MPDVYTAAFLFMVTFLLICWVVTEFQIYNDSHSMNDELKKPHMASRMSVGQNRFWNALDSNPDFRQDRLREKNKSTFLFGIRRRDKKEESRLAGRTNQRQQRP